MKAGKIKSESVPTYGAVDKHAVDQDQDRIIAQAMQILEGRMRCGDSFRSPESVKKWIALHLYERLDEHFGVLYLDNRHRLIEWRDLFSGSIAGASVHPRVVVREALRCNAAAAICYHNHPSGVAEPSAADETITRTLRQALDLIEVRLLDHIIVAGARRVSLAELGLI